MRAFGLLGDRLDLRLIHLEEVNGLGRVLTRDIMECGGGDVVGLALSDQAVVLEQVLQFRLITLGLGLEDSLCLSSGADTDISKALRCRPGAAVLEEEEEEERRGFTYWEMFSNCISTPRAVLAAVASSLPAQSIGPGVVGWLMLV